ncbi:MAG: NfeD family protein [Candidatus Hydrogenedentes bacterium]|nr:NfeD family protein [Candidatus Hydrogenedentota bacterium]
MHLAMWHLWIILGLVLLITEIFTTGFLVSLFGVACAVPAVLSVSGVGLAGQLLGFVVASAVLLFAVRPICVRLLHREGDASQTNVDGLVGREGVVVEAISSSAHTGRVKIGGEDWKAVSPFTDEVPLGARVCVRAITGCTVEVDRVR